MTATEGGRLAEIVADWPGDVATDEIGEATCDGLNGLAGDCPAGIAGDEPSEGAVDELSGFAGAEATGEAVAVPPAGEVGTPGAGNFERDGDVATTGRDVEVSEAIIATAIGTIGAGVGAEGVDGAVAGAAIGETVLTRARLEAGEPGMDGSDLFAAARMVAAAGSGGTLPAGDVIGAGAAVAPAVGTALRLGAVGVEACFASWAGSFAAATLTAWVGLGFGAAVAASGKEVVGAATFDGAAMKGADVIAAAATAGACVRAMAEAVTG